MKMSELLGKVRLIGEKAPHPDVLPPSGDQPKTDAAGAGK
jgi:hypothetical protein